MARKGNPISVRLDLNRSSDSSWFSDYYYGKSVYQDVNLRSYFGSIRPPTRLTFGFRLGRCIIIHFPKRTFIHFFLPRRPRRLKRREKSRPVKEKGRWGAFGKVGPIGCLHSSDGTEEERNEVRGRGAGKRVESIRLDDREKQNEIRIWPLLLFFPLNLIICFVVRCFGLILFYFFYIHFLFFIFNLIPLMPFDFLIDEIGSQPLDFGWTCHFDNGAGGSNLPALIPRESAASSDRVNPYEIYERIKILEARDYYNLPPQNNPGDYERLVKENLSRAWNMKGDFYNRVFRLEYFELRVLELKGILQDRLTNLMLSEPNIGRIMELTHYSDVRTEAYHFIEDRYPPVFLNSFDLPPSRFIIDDSLNSLRSLTTGLNNVDHDFYKDFYRHFRDEEFRRSIGLPLP